jgi:hypothetical protein
LAHKPSQTPLISRTNFGKRALKDLSKSLEQSTIWKTLVSALDKEEALGKPSARLPLPIDSRNQDIHDGQEHKSSVQGSDTEAQDQLSPDHHIRLATHGRSIRMGHERAFGRHPEMIGVATRARQVPLQGAEPVFPFL